jgi:hypothetical protein
MDKLKETVVHVVIQLEYKVDEYIEGGQYLLCNENPIYVFAEKELRGISPNFHIHVCERFMYIYRIGPTYFPAAE